MLNALLEAEARRLWAIYSETVKPTSISRIAVRYINKIKIPAGEDLRDYLTTNFDLAPKLPQTILDFLLRISIPFPAQECVAIIHQTFAERTKDEFVPLIFDIDVIHEVQPDFDQSEIWTKLEDLRYIKNRIFHESLQPILIEQFK